MHILIAYDTVYGNTEKVAQALQTALGSSGVTLLKARAASLAWAACPHGLTA
jgi:flavodoxin